MTSIRKLRPFSLGLSLGLLLASHSLSAQPPGAAREGEAGPVQGGQEAQAAQGVQQAQQAQQARGAARKRAEIARTELAPNLDGILDDEIWKMATLISDLHQVEPVDQGEPSERSEFYLAYSEDYFYLAARLYDSNPAAISARQLVQGSGLGFDDSIEFILDTFNNGRTGYFFQANPNGIRRDGVYDQPNRVNEDWSGIWRVEGRIDAQGWTAEVAIPFTTLNFDPNSEEWGFTVVRNIARKQEEIAWSSFNRSTNPTTTGLISGIRGIKQGRGLDIIPAVVTLTHENHVTGFAEEIFDPSLNVFYKITPNLTGVLTLNTDFSATEVDNRQVNLSRFSLFFPEKRDFFLQDVDIFSFGGRGGRGFGNDQNGLPFYSRRIGLSRRGQPIDIDAGVKMTGRVGQWNVGALAVQQGDSPGLDGQPVFVGRVSANVLSESSVGAILTVGDPNSERDNTLAGVDFRYQNTRFSNSHTLSGNAWYQQTDTDGRDGDAKAFGVSANLETRGSGFSGNASYTYFGEDYFPALGFANRTGIESFGIFGRGNYLPPDHPLIRSVAMFGRYGHTRYLDTGELQSENVFLRFLDLETHRGDELGLVAGRNREGLRRDFEIQPGIVIPAGKHSFGDVGLQLNFSNQRVFSPSLSINRGKFYTGDRDRVTVGFSWRPNEHVYFSLRHNYQDIQLPQGDFNVRLISANANYAFNSKWSWVNLIQYDNESHSVGLNSRFRWNPQAGEDLYLVINYNFDADGAFRGLNPEESEIALKYTKTFRF